MRSHRIHCCIFWDHRTVTKTAQSSGAHELPVKGSGMVSWCIMNIYGITAQHDSRLYWNTFLGKSDASCLLRSSRISHISSDISGRDWQGKPRMGQAEGLATPNNTGLEHVNIGSWFETQFQSSQKCWGSFDPPDYIGPAFGNMLVAGYFTSPAGNGPETWVSSAERGTVLQCLGAPVPWLERDVQESFSFTTYHLDNRGL